MDIQDVNKEFSNIYEGDNILRSIDIITDGFFILFPSVNREKLREMVDENYKDLMKYYDGSNEHFKSFSYLTIDKNGPLEKFLSIYVKVNNSVDAFCHVDGLLLPPLNILSKLIESGKLTTSQIADTCDESDRILLIYNSSFWRVTLGSSADEKKDPRRVADYLLQFGPYFLGSWYNSWQTGERLTTNSKINDALLSTYGAILGTPDGTDQQRYNFGLISYYVYLFTDLFAKVYEGTVSKSEFVDNVKKAMTTFSITKDQGLLSVNQIDRNINYCEMPDETRRLGF